MPSTPATPHIRHLVIDDERTLAPDGEVQHVRTSAAALELLQSGATFDVIWFDHDLGVTADGPDTTRPVALWLEELAVLGQPRPAGQIVIHTANPVGRSWLQASLHAYRPQVVDAAAWLADPASAEG